MAPSVPLTWPASTTGCPALALVDEGEVLGLLEAVRQQRVTEWTLHLVAAYGVPMYLASIVLLMLIVPAVAVATDGSQADLMDLVGKYFVFWAVGVRLFTAGVRQILKPGLTSDGILGIKGRDSWILVRELGFANAAIGAVAIVSLWHAEWRTAGALAGAVFLVLAGAQHVLKRERSREETIAMVSDLAIGMLMGTYLLSR